MSGDEKLTENAKEIRDAAASWISRRDSDAWSDDDRVALDAWLAQSHAHLLAFLRAEAAWLRADKLAALHSAPKPHDDTFRGIRTLVSSVVAATLALAVLVGGGIYFSGSKAKFYATAIGGHKIVTLDDGSQISLNTDTALRVDLNEKSRKVWLEHGEAYFTIRHDVARPFTVMAGTGRLIDLGTEFSVRREGARLEIAVVKGKVAFDDARKPQDKSTALMPGDVAMTTKAGFSVTRKSLHAIMDALGWRRGLLIFDNTTLADAAHEFNRYNGETLVIADSAARLPVVGTFKANDSGAFARVAQQVFGLLVKKRGGQIVISR